MHNNKFAKPIVTASLLVALCLNTSAALAAETKPNLVLQITVDGCEQTL